MEQDKINSLTMSLLETVRVVFEAEIAKNTALAATLERALAVFPELSVDSEQPKSIQKSVCRHLSRALELGEAGPVAQVAAVIRELEPSLAWLHNPRHTVATRGDEFMDNYAYCDFGFTGSTRLYVGVMLLGPGITYPVTSYPCEGTFLVIGGSPQWKSGEEPWRQVEAGSIVCRPNDGAEGKRPGEEPMLALYAWLYD